VEYLRPPDDDDRDLVSVDPCPVQILVAVQRPRLLVVAGLVWTLGPETVQL
jgi:hypothetical protein